MQCVNSKYILRPQPYFFFRIFRISPRSTWFPNLRIYHLTAYQNSSNSSLTKIVCRKIYRNFQVNIYSKMSSTSRSSDSNASPTNVPVNLDSVLTWPKYFVEHKLKPPTPCEEDAEDSEEEVVIKNDVEINEKISIWRGDITKLKIDAIVNAANSMLLAGGGVDGCIHRAAGQELQDECGTLDGCPEGSSKITKGYKLPAKHVIHTVGPRGEKPSILESAYESALELMLKHNLRSIAFPCISTGIYGYPQNQAAHVALSTVREFMEKNNDKVDRVIFATFLSEDVLIYEELLQKYFPLEEIRK